MGSRGSNKRPDGKKKGDKWVAPLSSEVRPLYCRSPFYSAPGPAVVKAGPFFSSCVRLLPHHQEQQAKHNRSGVRVGGVKRLKSKRAQKLESKVGSGRVRRRAALAAKPSAPASSRCGAPAASLSSSLIHLAGVQGPGEGYSFQAGWRVWAFSRAPPLSLSVGTRPRHKLPRARAAAAALHPPLHPPESLLPALCPSPFYCGRPGLLRAQDGGAGRGGQASVTEGGPEAEGHARVGGGRGSRRPNGGGEGAGLKEGPAASGWKDLFFFFPGAEYASPHSPLCNRRPAAWPAFR